MPRVMRETSKQVVDQSHHVIDLALHHLRAASRRDRVLAGQLA